MKVSLSACALVLVLALGGPAAALTTAATVSYAPPAGNLPTGHLHGATYRAVLPSGRLVTPAGTSVTTGVGAMGLAISPDGRFAIVGNDDAGTGTASSLLAPGVSDGYALAVVDTATLAIVSRYVPPSGETYYGGVIAVPDPQRPAQALVLAAGGASDAVYAFTLDAFGRLTPDPHHTIAIAGPADRLFADAGHSVPATLVVSRDGRRAYVVNAAGGSVATIDLASRTLAGAVRPVGFFPSGIALAGDRLLVTNEGMMRYALAPERTLAPPFGTPPAALRDASSLSLVDLTTAGALVPPALETAGISSVPMDPPADGLRIVGGAHPSAVVATRDGHDAFVAMTNVDRIATIALDGIPHVAGGTELRLFDRGPYGTQPCALALSADGSRLYVALRGLNAVAVVDARDPVHLHRLGLIPTGWAPSALALSADDRTLYVVNTNGFGHDANTLWSTLQRIDLADVKLADTTRATLAATRRVVAVPASYPAELSNVVVVAVEHQSFDAIFGDLGDAAADPAFVRFGAAATPNLHALAERFALAGNFSSDADRAAVAQRFLVSGLATPFAEQNGTLNVPVFGGADDPEDAPRIGSIFAELARRDAAFRDYGGFLDLAGFDGSTYGYDVPAAAALAGHVDLAYPSANPNVSDARRADEFVRDYGAHVATGVPRFAYVALPSAQPGDTDAAVGTIVENLSHLSTWRTTAVIVVSTDTQGTPDHVDAARAYALVISPYAKRGFLGMRHLSTASVLKTVDGVMRLPSLSLGDLLANDLSDFFTPAADLRPYVAVRAVNAGG